MATFIVDLSDAQRVHVTDNIQPACEIEKVEMRVDVDTDYTELFQGLFSGCPHCYAEKAQ